MAWWAAVPAVLAATVLAACDSQVGIEGTDYHRDSGSATTQSATATASETPNPTPADSSSVTIALVTADARATEAVGRWAADLQKLAPAELEAKCWTMAPRNVDTMYADKTAILSALAQPGTDNGTAIVWKSAADGVTVVAERTDIATGYACPRVYPGGAEIGFGTSTEAQAADARHIVRRYLARQTGHPVDPADEESTHPLVCSVATAWDPNGTGRSARAPLATNAAKLAAPTAFADQSLSSSVLNGTYLTVSATVTAGGAQQERTYTVKATDDGYCIGDVSAGGA
ncbi:hypothetical protein [Nocardia veterana]|uniref:Lipoprotein n=1 Tax=Nocardia veterana TaxID=132249 RepID=A0A7X6LXD8_9NOCA|nr:hypothetical protein [Nocardia veterana]NKY85557.1 hypothetical protein [Nocardia veterana]